jgi:hypothetical protein
MRRRVLAVIATVMVCVALPGLAAAAELSAPAATSWSGSRFDVIARGSDGMIYHNYWDDMNGSWSGWGTIGAPPVGVASSPTVTTPGPDVLQVFVRGNDNQIWNNHWTHGQGSAPGGWSGWGAVPNTGNATWAPAATDGPDDQPDVFYTGTDNATYYTRYDRQLGWVAPVSLGGVVQGSPAVTTTTGGRLQLIVRGSDNRVYHRFADSPTGWTGWGVVANAFTSMSPAMTTGDDGQVNIFMRGVNDAWMYHEYWNVDSGWIGPGGVPNSVLVSSPAAARLHVYYRDTGGDVMQQWYSPTSGWAGPRALGQPRSDGSLFREQSANAVYYVDGGVRHWVTSPSVAAAAGLDLSTTQLVPDGSLNTIPRGADITMSSLDEGGPEPDPGTATSAGTSWVYTGYDNFAFLSADARATAQGKVKWYGGKFPKGYLHRGDYDFGSTVSALGPVPCMWARVKWGYPSASVSLPPGGSVGGAEVIDGYFVKCRPSGQSAPTPIALTGLGYAKAFLNSTILTVCTSNTRAEGARFCSNHKMTYPW